MFDVSQDVRERVIRPGVTEIDAVEPLRAARRDTAVISACALIVMTLAGVGALLFVTNAGAHPGPLLSAGPTAAGPSLLPTTALPVPAPAVQTEPPASIEPAAGLTRAGMTRLVRTYLLRAADEPAAGYALMSPTWQRTSGGFAAYRSFWIDITYATPSRIVANPASGRVTFDVRYRHRDAHHTYGHTTMWVVRDAQGRYLVAGEHR